MGDISVWLPCETGGGGRSGGQLKTFNAKQKRLKQKQKGACSGAYKQGKNELYASFIFVVAVLVAAIVVLGGGNETIHVHCRAIRVLELGERQPTAAGGAIARRPKSHHGRPEPLPEGLKI